MFLNIENIENAAHYRNMKLILDGTGGEKNAIWCRVLKKNISGCFN